MKLCVDKKELYQMVLSILINFNLFLNVKLLKIHSEPLKLICHINCYHLNYLCLYIPEQCVKLVFLLFHDCVV